MEKARDDERDLRQPPGLEVLQVVVLDGRGAGVVRPPFPEDEDVVRLAVGHIVEADVVDLPAHACSFEKVQDDRIVEDPISEDVVVRDPA
jgi:hypothetical protein